MKILSYNIQAAIHTSSYLSYSYQWPRQILPTPAKTKTLQHIATFIDTYDIVCLQEVELGGLRNNFNSQRDQLLKLTHFSHDLVQINRRIAKLSVHGNLILSKYPIESILNTALPSRIPGRGVLSGAVMLPNDQRLIITNSHLSLGKHDQQHQLEFITHQLKNYPNVLLCGDLNATPTQPPLQILEKYGYSRLNSGLTFPSWKPKKALDHAFIKGNLTAQATVIPFIASDHLPISITINA